MSTISIQAYPANDGYPGPTQNEGTPSVAQDIALGRAAPGAVYYFTVSRTGDTSGFETVNWVATGSGANPAPATEFVGGVPPSGTITFQPGESTATIQVSVQPNFQPAPDQGFTVTLVNPGSGSVIDPVNGTASGVILNDDVATKTGTTGNDKINLSNSAAPVFVNASQGGNDTITGSAYNDTFYLGATLTSADQINGGGGNDTLVLDGNYSTTPLTLGAKTVTNVENLYLQSGNNYNVTLNAKTVPKGATMNIDASSLGSQNSAVVSGAKVSGNLYFLGGASNDVFTGGNGTNTFVGGAGNDTMTGGKGANTFIGGLGADTMTGGKGQNTFVYQDHGMGSAADSPIVVSGGVISASSADTINSFHVKTDHIDLSAFFPGPGTVSVVSKTTAGYSSNIGTGAGFFGTAGVVVEYSSKSSSANAQIYVDVNHDGVLNNGDLLITVNKVGFGKITANNFVF